MSGGGELQLGMRRPSTPGNTTEILFNQQGVEGSDYDLTWDFSNNSLNVGGNLVVTQNTTLANVLATNANVVTLNVSSNIANAGNVLVTQNTITGNLTVVQNASAGNLTVTQNTVTGNLVAANVQGLNANAQLVSIYFNAFYSGAQ